MARDTLSLNAGQELPVYESGSFFRFLAGDHPITARFEGGAEGQTREIELDPGIGVRVPSGWESLLIKSEQAQTITYLVWEAEVFDNRRTGQVVTLTKAGALNTPADQTVTGGNSAEVLAANPERREAVLISDPTNTDPIRVGGSGVGLAAGLRLDPGQSVTLETAAAVHVYAVTNSATVQALEVND